MKYDPFFWRWADRVGLAHPDELFSRLSLRQIHEGVEYYSEHQPTQEFMMIQNARLCAMVAGLVRALGGKGKQPDVQDFLPQEQTRKRQMTNAEIGAVFRMIGGV